MTEPTTPTDLAFLPVAAPDGTIRRTAHRFTPGAGPVIVFLPGYMSDMAGSKATALFDRAKAEGRACLCLDYSGCGLSEGSFADGTLSHWCAEVLALIAAKCPGPVLLVGSSMGGWLMLLVALALADGAVPGVHAAALVGIAAAPDFTEWGTSEADKSALAAGQTVWEDNPYGPESTPTHPGFWTDGQAQLLLNGVIPLDCPVRLLHGQADPDVPWEISLRLAAALRSGDVQVTLVKDGDHRLSREADIALILATVSALADAT
jgi:pimeloyl-ACP methyl ester carboxylesterase